MRKVFIGLAVTLVALAGACQFLVPERFAINAPMAHQMTGLGGVKPSETSLGTRIRVPEGFAIGLYASGLRNARFLRPTAGGHLLVSRPRAGEVWLLEPDRDGDGHSDGQRVVLTDLNRPHGMDLHDGWLYVAEGDGVGRVHFDAASGRVEGRYERVVNDLPSGGNHWSRTVRFGPDGWMYVSVGSSCNVCEDAPRRAAMLRFRPDGSGEEVYATGLRNSVGFDWRPGTGDLYATDNGRDLLGNDFPPCELNLVVRGGFYGWPYVNGDQVPDPDFGDRRPDLVRAAIPPAHGFRAHNAPLGIAFIRGGGVPPAYRGAALAALHGSWNRTEKDGYKVVSLHWQPDGTIEERDFATGFELDGDVIGRPVDVAEGADGALYISDDYAGAVYRVVYGRPAGATAAGDPAVATTGERGDPLALLSPDERAARSARGEALYERFACAGCHEVERAEPGVVAVELADLGERYSIDELTETLATPTPPMPVFPLEPEERRDLATFLLGR